MKEFRPIITLFRRIFFLSILFASHNFYGQSVCAQAQPICANSQNLFPAATTGTAQSGPAYGCLAQQPRPSWHSIHIANSGSLTLIVTGLGGGDVDFICYGPFSSPATGCSNLTAGNIVGCSYSASSTETVTINNAIAGQYYILLITNFWNGGAQDVTVVQSVGTGSLDCSSVCNMTGITSTVSSVCTSSSQYSVTGSLFFTNPPTIGTLSINASAGGTAVVTQTYLASSVSSPLSYSFTNLPIGSGGTRSVTAMFSALSTCSAVTVYTAPITIGISSSSPAICSGNGVTLTATGSATSYTWFPNGENTSVIVVTPTASTTYSVVGSNGVACTATTAITQTVDVMPSGLSAGVIGAPPQPSPAGYCIGTPAIFNFVGIASNATSYSLFPTNPLVTGTIDFPFGLTAAALSPTVSTTYTFVASNGGACGTASALPFTILIDPGPSMTVTTSSAAICVGKTATLNASAPTATAFLWVPGGSTANTQTVSPPVGTTNYSVVATNSNGCSSITHTINQIVNAVATVSASSSSPSVCIGNNVTLSASGSATTYTWIPGNLVGANVSVSPTVNTTYTVTGSNSSGCTSQNTVQITAIPKPTLTAVPSSTSLCGGETLTLSATGADSYTWTLTTSTLFVSAQGTVVVPTSGSTQIRNYVVTGPNALGCTNTATASVTVFPLPSTASYTLAASPASVCAGDVSTLTAMDAFGYTYTWSSGTVALGSGTTIVAGPPVIPTTTSTSNRNITYTAIATSSLGCNSAVKTVIVRVPGVPNIGGAPATTTTICLGEAVSMTASVATAFGFTSQPNNATATGSILVFSDTPSVTTIYTITAENSIGCTTFKTRTVTVVPMPTITAVASSPTICSGKSVTLTASIATSFTGTPTYSWQPPYPNNTVAYRTASLVPVSPNLTTTTTFTVVGRNTVGAKVCTDTTTVTVMVNPNPILVLNAVPASSVCPDGTTALSVSGANSYTWLPLANIIGSNTLASITASPGTTAKTYTVSAEDNLGCSSNTTIAVSVVPLITPSITASSLSVCAGSSVTLTGSGSTGGYTWTSGGTSTIGTSITDTPSITTSYTLIGENSLGCTTQTVRTITVTSLPTIVAMSTSSAICNGETATLSVNGANNYTWQPSAQTGTQIMVSPMVTTVYTVTGSSSSCTSNTIISLIVNNGSSLTVSANPSTVCPSGTSSLSVSGASSYTWSGINLSSTSGASVTANPSVTTTYTVNATNSFGCNSSKTIALNVQPLPSLVFSSSSSSVCVGNTVMLTGSGAAGGYTWTSVSTTTTGTSVVVTPTVTTTYTLTGANSLGCTTQTVRTIIVVPLPTVSVTSTPSAICNGATATLTASGATNYTWTGVGTNSQVSVNPTVTTTYTVIGNSSGCSSTRTISLIVNNPPVLVASVSPTIICPTETATLSASNGAASYSWSPIGVLTNTAVVSPLATQVYTVTAFSAAGCASVQTVSLTVVPASTASITASQNSICVNQSVNLTASGATNYTWLPTNSNSASIVVSPTVTTSYTLIGSNGACSSSAVTTVTVHALPNINIAASPSATICNGATTTLTANGASTYTWSTLSVTNNISVSPVTNTTYSVSGTSSVGCLGSQSINVVVNPIPSLTISSTSPSLCAGQSATLSGLGGSTYTWQPFNIISSSLVVTPSVTLVYTLSGTNAFGCTNFTTFSLPITPIPVINVSASSPSICLGASATLSVSGANNYTWNPGNHTGSVYPVSPTNATTYSVVGANNGCSSATQTITIGVEQPLITAASSSSVVCFGNTVTLTANGLSTYTWQPVNTVSASITDAPSATTIYSVSGVSAGGCNNFTTVAVSVIPLPTLTAISSSNAICNGMSATLTASGADTYTWSGGISSTNTMVIVNPTVTTNYTLSGQNANCSIVNTVVTLVVNYGSSLTLSANPASVCPSGTSSLTASGASTYTWISAGTGSQVTVNPATTTNYTVNATNSFGCSSTNTIDIVVIPPPTLTTAVFPATSSVCAGSSVVIGATGANSYTWQSTSGTFTGSILTDTPTATTIYTVIGDNIIGCTSTETVSVLVVQMPTLVAMSNPTAICDGAVATLTVNGADNYTWTGVGTGSNVSVTPSVTTSYSVTGNISTCVSTTVVNVTVNYGSPLTVNASPTIVCPNGTSSLTVSGASTYTWIGVGTSSQVTVNPATTTNYTVNATNNFGCSSTNTVDVVVMPLPTLIISSNSSSICAGSAVSMTASGASAYTWTPSGATNSVLTDTPTSNTIYTVTGANGLGCTSENTISVLVVPMPTLMVAANPTAICEGSTATLTVNGADSYIWTGLGTGSTVPVNPTITTTYSVTGNVSTCVSNTVITLVVNYSSPLTLAANPASVCPSGTSSLTASGASTYTWISAGTGSQVTVNPATTTNYTVNATNSFGCSSTNTIDIVVIPPPTLTTAVFPATSSVCAGSSVVIGATGANSYTWQSTSGTFTGSILTDTPAATTIYTVIGDNIIGCTSTKTVSVLVVPIPTLAAALSSTAICESSTATLTVNGADSYTWQPTAQTGSQVSVSPALNTTYTVTGEASGCASDATVALVVNPLPTVSATSSTANICIGETVTLTATSSTSNFSWSPLSSTSSSVTDAPATTTNYTVSVTDANNCINSATVNVVVNSLPSLTITASTTSLCSGNTVTLDVNGTAANYLWLPSNSTGTTVTETPNVTSIYVLSGTTSAGCAATETILINVIPTPTLTITASNTLVCENSPVTFTVSGAVNYTWLPMANNGTTAIDSPSITTTYSVVGDDGAFCSNTATIDIFVIPIPTASAVCAGTLNCMTPTVLLMGSSTSTNVGYEWFGPSAYTSTLQTPADIVEGGTYTLAVTDLVAGCVGTATVDVPVNYFTPTLTATTSGSITCAVSVVTLDVLHNSTNAIYDWSGPQNFTSTAQNFTTDVVGIYTVIVTDQTSFCSTTALVEVGYHLSVEITASIAPATCSANGISNNDGTITLFNFGSTDKYDLVQGTSYTGTATYTTATLIPTSGIVTSSLANPTITTAYTIRLFDSEGCIKDTTLFLEPMYCATKVLGIAKAATASTMNSNGTYDVTYTLVVKNYDMFPITNVVLKENLAATFHAPATFTIDAIHFSANSSLSLNPSYTGIAPNETLTIPTSSLAAGKSDTITFTVKVTPHAFFGPYKNSVIGHVLTGGNIAVIDSSNTGLNPDPDGDNDPTNNNVPTVIYLTPNLVCNITKSVSASHRLQDATIDLSYTISVENMSNDTLYNVSVKDSLYEKTIKYPASYSIKTLPVADGNLTANAFFDGNTDIDLINPSLSKIAPGAVSKITFVVNVNTDTVRVISNQVKGRALSSINSVISYTSNIAVVTVENFTLFIPQGFSPNDDGINDAFVIKGMPKEGNNELTIYNRWGSKVYHSDNYDNTWKGYPNVNSALGSNKLPQGTYYYILDMKGSGGKPITGFIVLQY